jgi:hypothetical protein
LSYGLNFFKGMLQNPNIWVSDMVFSDQDADSTNEVEQYLASTCFTTPRVSQMLKTIVTQYIVFSNDEVELWKLDSLKFFLHMKYA